MGAATPLHLYPHRSRRAHAGSDDDCGVQRLAHAEFLAPLRATACLPSASPLSACPLWVELVVSARTSEAALRSAGRPAAMHRSVEPPLRAASRRSLGTSGSL